MNKLLACAIIGTLFVTLPASAKGTKNYTDLINKLPTITLFHSDGAKLTDAEYTQVMAVVATVSDTCATQLAPQWGSLSPVEFVKSLRGPTDPGVQYAWNECVTRVIAKQEDEGNFPSGVIVMVTTPRP